MFAYFQNLSALFSALSAELTAEFLLALLRRTDINGIHSSFSHWSTPRKYGETILPHTNFFITEQFLQICKALQRHLILMHPKFMFGREMSACAHQNIVFILYNYIKK